jgi:hypothetical protein
MRTSSLLVIPLVISIADVVTACGSSSKANGGGPGGGSEASHPALPLLVEQGVGVLTAPKIVTVTFPGDANAVQLEAFGATVTNNSWWDTVRKGFCDPGSTTSCLGDGPSGTKVELTTAPAATYTDSSTGQTPSSLQTFIQGLIPAAIPQPDAQTMLVFYFPSTTTIMLDGQSSCSVFGGYHNSMTVGGTRFAYAVVNECPPMTGTTRTPLQETTLEASHEILEAATDPAQIQTSNGQEVGYYLNLTDPSILPWNAVAGGEAGDLCLDFLGLGQDATTEGGFTVQRIWSNAAAAAGGDPCVPAVADTYFNVAPETWLLATDVGGSATFTADAFSTAAIADWNVEGYDLNATSAANLSPYLAITVNGAQRTTVKNGDKVAVKVTLKQDPSNLSAYDATLGAVGLLVSYNGDPTNPKTATAGHFWPFLVTSNADAVDSGLNTADAAAEEPIRPPPLRMTRDARANLARAFPNLKSY